MENQKLIFVGERINATGKTVAEALRKKDEDFFVREALAQQEAGCDFLDLNCGTGGGEGELMAWLAAVLDTQVSVPFFFDSSDAAVIEKGLSHVSDPARHVVNSVTLEENRLSALLPVVRDYGCGVVGLLMDDKGVPASVEGRVEIANVLMDHFDAHGVSREKVFLDPIAESVAVDTSKAYLSLQCIEKLKTLVAPARIIISVSGVSYGLPKRSVLNRAFLCMAAYAGADAVIADPLDQGIASAIAAVEALLNRDPYCMKYLDAFRKGRL